jgi:hypothetical protein
MAPKRNRELATENKDQETQNPQPEGTGRIDRFQELVKEARAKVERMQAVDTLIRSTMKDRSLQQEQKIGHITDELYKMGMSDDEVIALTTPHKGQDGNFYMGYTFAEINAAKNELKTREIQLGALQGKGKFTAAEDARRALQQGNEQQLG